MKLKQLITSAIVVTSALAYSVLSIAHASNFKVATFKADAKALITAKSKLSSRIKSENTDALENYVATCVTHLTNNAIDDAQDACNKAVDGVNAIKQTSSHVNYVRSLIYSNRAIAKHLNNDSLGAYRDLTTALLIDDNAIVKFNLALMGQSAPESDISVSAE